LARVRKLRDWLKLAVANVLKQTPTLQEQDLLSIFHVPFVDYARGDGLAIGPQQENMWSEAHLLEPLPGWVSCYRGLWGVYVHDPISGENAPSGPMYNRDGSVRQAWYDPLGWAGLDKVPTPGEAVLRLRARLAQMEKQCQQTQSAIVAKSEELLGLGVQADALREQPHLKDMYAETQAQIYAISEEVDGLRARMAQNDILCESLTLHLAQLEAGERPPVHAHLRHPHFPSSAKELQVGRLAEGWAAVSVGLILVGFVLLIVFARQYLALGLGAMVAVVLAVEAISRRQLRLFVTRVTVALASFCGLILIYDFFWALVVLIVFVIGGYLMIENLRELRT
jgi:hypothetical protein